MNEPWNMLNNSQIKYKLELSKDYFLEKLVDDDEEADSLIFGTGFGGMSDIETGPDGYLYVLSFKEGKLYMIFKE